MNEFSDLITLILNFFGIYQAPVTVQEFLWDLIILIVGFVLVKAILAFVFGFFREVSKM